MGKIALWGGKSPQGLILRDDIPLEIFERYKLLCGELNAYEKFQQAFQTTQETTIEVETAIARLLEERSIPLLKHHYEIELRKLNRDVVECLSAFKMFLDHAEVRANRKYGEGSRQLQAFKEATAYEFDTSAAYRFCYNLRNYLHASTPINHFSESQTFREDGGIRCTYRVGFDIPALLSTSSKWHSKVREDFAEMKDDFLPAAGIFHTLYESIGRINLAIFDAEKELLVAYATELKSLVQDALDKGLRPSMGEFGEGESFTTTLHHTPLDMMDKLGVIKVTYRDLK